MLVRDPTHREVAGEASWATHVPDALEVTVSTILPIRIDEFEQFERQQGTLGAYSQDCGRTSKGRLLRASDITVSIMEPQQLPAGAVSTNG